MKAYLGDSVYAENCLDGIVLTTENGFGASNKIVMDTDVLVAFGKFMKKLSDLSEKETENKGVDENGLDLRR